MATTMTTTSYHHLLAETENSTLARLKVCGLGGVNELIKCYGSTRRIVLLTDLSGLTQSLTLRLIFSFKDITNRIQQKSFNSFIATVSFLLVSKFKSSTKLQHRIRTVTSVRI